MDPLLLNLSIIGIAVSYFLYILEKRKRERLYGGIIVEPYGQYHGGDYDPYEDEYERERARLAARHEMKQQLREERARREYADTVLENVFGIRRM